VPPPRAAPPRPQPFALAFVLGSVVAVGGAVLWAYVARALDQDLRATPVLIGLLIGLVMRIPVRRDRGSLDSLAIAAGALALFAMLLGHYLGFAFTAGGAASGSFPVLSFDTLSLFRESRETVFDLIDVAWAVGAVDAAFVALVLGQPGPRIDPGVHHSRNPVDRYTGRLTPSLRIAVDWVVTIQGAVAIVLLVKAFVVNPYRIPSSSMEPTLHCAQPASGCEASISDRVLANRFIYHIRDPRRGEIAVFETPAAARLQCGAGGTFVKRIVGLPGETLEVRVEKGKGFVYINGRKLREPYLQADRREPDGFGPKKIAAGNYFMMGDNRSASCDSRKWGTVPRKNLIGKVFATYWPPNRLGLH
jgi:signal peptidase I